MKVFLDYVLVLVFGGFICSIAQILIVRTRLTPARILIIFMLSGIFLEFFNLYEPLFKIFKCGISTPIVGFGASLTKGAKEYVNKYGLIGAFGGGLIRTAIAIGLSVTVSYLVTLIFKPKSK